MTNFERLPHRPGHANRAIFLFLRLLLPMWLLYCIGINFSHARSAQEYVLDIPVESVEPQKIAAGKLTVFPLDQNHLVLAGDFNDAIRQETKRCFGQRLQQADNDFTSGRLPKWSHRFFYRFAAATVTAACHPVIRDHFEDTGYFRLTDSRGQILAVEAHGYWINAVGLFRLPHQTIPGHTRTPSAELIHFAYLRLQQPLSNGDEINVTTADGALSSTFTFHDETVISRALKVNQVGYLPTAAKKYAYFGMWLGTLGEMPVRKFVGQEFTVRHQADHKIAWRGQVVWRSDEQLLRRKDNSEIPLNGEKVLELDFSPFNTPGKYYLHLPGAGRSWGFTIGEEALAEAFYITMRGLYHQRSGIAKTKAHTQWNFGADHQVSWRGGFSPHDRQYDGTTGNGCIIDKNGKLVKVSHFAVVKATATEEKLPEVFGGWWDAGDFDRRSQHFQVVEYLLTPYFLKTENFSDHQLDLPESGNGIADLVDEVSWGVDLWRRAQNEAGGVGCWLEATSHPTESDPAADTQRYYLALPTRESSMEYASYAADLARAYIIAGRPDLASTFRESARRAWNFARDESNRISISFTVDPKQGELTYQEPAVVPAHLTYRAALSLFLLTGDEQYQEIAAGEVFFQAAMRFVTDQRRPYFLAGLLSDHDKLRFNARVYREYLLREAEKLLRSQEELAYRNINWPLHHPYFLFLAWGAAMPLRQGAYLLLAWQLTGQERFRTAALLLVDWMHGANPMGRSMTTGLGKVYPVRILSHPVWSQEMKYVDPIPGIVPYTFTGRNNYNAVKSIFRLEVEERQDHQFPGCEATLLPTAWSENKLLSSSECYQIIQERIPVWRRFANLEDFAVDQNEFTVWETIAPAAAAYGMLMQPGWKPPPDWKQKKPKVTKEELPGTIFLP